MEYAATDILRFTLEDGDGTTGVINQPFVAEPQVVFLPECVNLAHCRKGSLISVYSTSGQLVQTVRADADGFASISLDGYRPGIYIIKTETHSFKIVKK